MSVETWICFWLAVIGIASVVNAHKPPVMIVRPEDIEKAGKDETESDDNT